MPEDLQEIKFKKQMLDFLENEENCFERSLESGHFTASCWLINKEGSHALLTHHAKLDTWLQLGGHCDGEHDILKVALTEAQEESGIQDIALLYDGIFDIDIHLIPENKKEKAHYHYDVRFLLQVVSNENIVVSSESKALAWVEKNKKSLPACNQSVIRMFDKWVAL